MGGFVACYNYLTFRLEAAPLGLSTTVTSLLFLAYLAGTVSSPLAGRLSDRFGGDGSRCRASRSRWPGWP